MTSRLGCAKRGVGQSLLVLALAASAGFALAQASEQRTLAYLRFGLGSEVMAVEGFKLDEELSKAFETALASEKGLRLLPFSRTHPSVRRALAEGSLKSQMLWPPYTGRSEGQFKGLVLGRLLRADYSLGGVIESYSFQKGRKTARFVASIELFDVKAGKLLGNIALAAEGSGESEPEAAKAAVEKYVSEVRPQVLDVLKAKKDDKPPRGS